MRKRTWESYTNEMIKLEAQIIKLRKQQAKLKEERDKK